MLLTLRAQLAGTRGATLAGAFLYQKDLGDDTEKTASAMNAFNPDEGWTVTHDEQEPSDQP